MLKQLIFLCVFLVDVSGEDQAQPNQLSQWPRFIGVKPGRNVVIQCKNFTGSDVCADVEWWKVPPASNAKMKLRDIPNKVNMGIFTITLYNLEPEDSGVYFCKVDGIFGPGSELQVHRYRDLESAIRRSKMKDAIISLQALLLVIFLLIPRFCYKQQAEREETIYEEPEDDHTYEGLDIEHCGLYEDIPAFSHQDADADADADGDADAAAEPCDMETPDQE